MQAVENTILVTITGTDSTIDLLNDRVRIKRNFGPTVELLLSTITAIKIQHKDNQNYQAYLQIYSAASSEKITFPTTRNKVFELFNLELDRLINASKNSLEGLLELEKMGELKEKGFVSEEEFNAKKQQILRQGIDTTNVENIQKAMESAIIAEEEETVRQKDEAEIAQKKQSEQKQGALIAIGAVIGSLFMLAGLIAIGRGAFINGVFILLTGITFTPVIHFLIKSLSRGRVQHFQLKYRMMILPVTIILSTFHYFDSPAQPEITEPPKTQKEIEAERETERQLAIYAEEMKQQKAAAEQKHKAQEAARTMAENEENDAKVDKLIELGVVTRMDCEFNEVFINPDEWAGANFYTKENFARAMMDYCHRHGGYEHTVTLKSDMDGKELGSIGLFGFKVK